MAIESGTSIRTTQIVLPKHDVERARPDGHARQDGKQARKERRDQDSESYPVSNDQGRSTGKLIDVTV